MVCKFCIKVHSVLLEVQNPAAEKSSQTHKPTVLDYVKISSKPTVRLNLTPLSLFSDRCDSKVANRISSKMYIKGGKHLYKSVHELLLKNEYQKLLLHDYLLLLTINM